MLYLIENLFVACIDWRKILLVKLAVHSHLVTSSRNVSTAFCVCSVVFFIPEPSTILQGLFSYFRTGLLDPYVFIATRLFIFNGLQNSFLSKDEWKAGICVTSNTQGKRSGLAGGDVTPAAKIFSHLATVRVWNLWLADFYTLKLMFAI